MEGFLQSLKFKNPDVQIEVCKIVGRIAKSRGRGKAWYRTQKLYWKGKELYRHSEDYQKLISREYTALSQNDSFKRAILSTGNATFTHSIGERDPRRTVLTKGEFCQQLYRVRERLKRSNIMLVETAIADSYGRGFEFKDQQFIQQHNTFSHYICSGCGGQYSIGTYTDDTQMVLAIVELLVEDPKLLLDEESVAQKFLDVYHRDIRSGYSYAFSDLLLQCFSGKELLQRLRRHSIKSGAAMRSMPIGLVSNGQLGMKYTISQAKVTHDSEEGILSAVLSMLLTHVCCYSGKSFPGDDLYHLIEEFLHHNMSGLPSDYKIRRWDWRNSPSVTGMDCVEAAIWLVSQYTSLSDIIRAGVALGGDTDTVCSIAVFAASCAKWVRQDIPEYFYTHLENGRYGYSYLLLYDNQLKKFAD